MSAFSLQLHQHGLPSEVVQLVEYEIPQPAKGEVLVKMLAAPINPSDRLHIQGRYRDDVRVPSQIGFEGVGIVIQNGGGLLGRMLQGARVVVLSKEGGTWGSHCIAKSKQAIQIPNALTIEQAAQYFINPATALLLSTHILGLKRGDWLLQSAGTSAVGRMVIALSQQVGFKTVSLVRRDAAIQELKSLGGEIVVNATDFTDAKTLRIRLEEQCGGLPIAAIDSIGGETGSMMLEALGRDGRMVCFGTASGEPLSINPRTLMQNQLTVESFWLGPYMQQQSLLKKLSLISRSKKLHLRGVFKMENVSKFPLPEFQNALQTAEQSSGGTKVLLIMSGD